MFKRLWIIIQRFEREVTMGFLLNIQSLKCFLREIEQRGMQSRVIRAFNKKYRMKMKDLKNKQILDLALKIENNNKQTYRGKESDRKKEKCSFWLNREHKLFCHILPYFFTIYNLSYQTLELTDLSPLSQIFLRKNNQHLLFEINQFLLPSPSKKNISWRKEEEIFLKNFMNKIEKNSVCISWKLISFELFRFNVFKLYRSPRECRQKWMNHLDPNIVKAKWTHQQEFELLKVVNKYGTKWSLIAKIHQSGRTENMVKNKVVSLIKDVCKKKSGKFKKGEIQIALKAVQRKLLLQSASENQIVSLSLESPKEKIKIEPSEVLEGSQNQGAETICNSFEPSFLIEGQFEQRDPFLLITQEGQESWQYEQSRILPGPHQFFEVLCSESLF